MATLLVKNKIETFEQLSAHRDACQRALSLLCALREKERRGQCEAPSQMREKIKTLRRELRLCEEIRTDSLLLQKKREALRELARQKQRTKQRRKAADMRRNGHDRRGHDGKKAEGYALSTNATTTCFI